MSSNLTITQGKGFQMRFENNYTISVQFGRGNYCQNKNANHNEFKDWCESEDAEIAVWGWTMEQLLVHDQVVGWLKADDVARAISYVQKGQIRALKRMCRSRM